MGSRLITACIWASAMAVSLDASRAQVRAPVDPAPMKKPVATTVGIGDGYGVGTLDQFYDVRITVLEVVRGEKALALLKQASPSIQVPKSGLEYLLARIKFEFLAKTGNYGVSEDMFSATSPVGKEYDSFIVRQLKPSLNGRLYSGESLEGWVAFQVSSEDNKPLMTFGQGGIQGPGQVWFQLY